jgi:Uma2 family endonuclease
VEYLRYEQESDIRHELVDGYLYGMVGSSDRHEEISGNLFAALHQHLRNTPCRVYGSNLKLRVRDNFYYPDLFVRCSNEQGDRYFKTDPVLVVEILSPSTLRYDRGDKRLAYQTLASLKEYVLISQDTQHAEIYRRVGEGWEHIIYDPDTDHLPLTSMNFTIQFSDLYA